MTSVFFKSFSNVTGPTKTLRVLLCMCMYCATIFFEIKAFIPDIGVELTFELEILQTNEFEHAMHMLKKYCSSDYHD